MTNLSELSLSLNWAYAFGKPTVKGLFRCQPQDFWVNEILGFEPSGEGEHVFLHVEKRGDNTAWLARQIARLAEVETRDIGYAGLKDRHGITRQWFSVYLPKGPEPDWQQLNTESITLLHVTRHSRKLRRGEHQGNEFQIRLRALEGDLSSLRERVEQVRDLGVPNYFGEQRFGHNGNNLIEAQRLLVERGRIKNRQKRGMVLSAARSYLFNQVLSRRIERSNWLSLLSGEPQLLQGEKPVPNGPLWGRGRNPSSEECEALENQVLESLASWRDGLEHVGMEQERRPLLLRPTVFESRLDDDQLEVSFSLPPGTYATAVLRELLLLKDVSLPPDVV